MSQKYLKSIKSRMGWQVGLQAATLLAVGGVNSQIKEQTDYIGSCLNELQENTIEGFSSVVNAVNSLEASLISGLEEIKWYLGSIDDKLGKIVGLIEYSKATESSEQFKIGMELFKQEFYEKAANSFNKSFEANPLNINALVGLYLTEKKKDKKLSNKKLEDIIKLTGTDFLYHLKTTNTVKENSINYFINFSFGEFLENKSYKSLINFYENSINSFSKEHLPIKLKYINALVLSGKPYNQYISDILSEGQLGNLMLFFKYEENNVNVVEFIKHATELIRVRLPNSESYVFKPNPNTLIENKAIFLKEKIYGDLKFIMKLGFYQTSLAKKVKALKTFFDAALSTPSSIESTIELIETNENNLNIINSIQKPIFFKETESFCKDANNELVQEINKHIDTYKNKTSNGLKSEVTKLKKIHKEFSSSYPKLDNETDDSYKIIKLFIQNIDESNKAINLEKIFSNQIFK